MKYNVFNVKNHKLIPIGLSMCLLMIGANLFAHEGALTGVFSISATEKVNFSKGNLQYQASTRTWRFADQQYNIIGSSGNSKASSTYGGWIDWFAWGTSGWNSGAKYYQPWEIQPTWDGDDFNPGGSTTSDLAGTYQNADWGVYNAISNGGNTAGQWRVLSKDECYYLFNNRTNAKNLYFFATVGGIRGLVVLPDNWNSTSLSFIKNKNEYYGDNAISSTDWTNWEKSGAVFLPSSEVSTSSGYVSTCDGRYWTSTHCTDAYSSKNATTLNFRNYSLNDYIYKVFANECTYRSERIYVRLVQTASNNNHTLLFNNNYPESNRANLYVGREYFSPDINVVYDPVSCFTSINGTQKKDVECTPFELIGIHSGDKISIRVYNYSGSRSHTIPACGVIDIVNKEGSSPSPRQWLDFITSEKDSLSNISITDSYKYLKLWLYNGGSEVVFSDYKFLVQVEKGETLSAVPSPSGHIITYGTAYGTLPQPPSRKGYTFEGWYTDSVSGTKITSSTIVTTTSDQVLYAHWKRIQNTILVSGTNGITSGAGTYFYGDTAILVATPDIGYHFAQWSDGNTENPRSITVTKDSTFIAEFAADTIDVSVYADCSKNGYNKDFTHIAAVNSSSGRTSCEWVQLWENGPKWATFNVGATITDYTNLTKGAEFTPFYNAFDQMQFCNTANVGGLYAWNNPNLNGRKTTWSSSVSKGTSDVATTLWGSNWKTPTEKQLDTLQNSKYSKTTWNWCDGSATQYVEGCSLKGFKVSGKGKYSENSIFLPAAGYFHPDYIAIVDPGNVGHYWSDTKYSPDHIYCLSFRSLDYEVISDIVYSSPWYGLSVRAVLTDSTATIGNVTITLKANNCSSNNVITCLNGQQLRISAVETTDSHFVKWSDGNTDNPRSVVVTQDSTFTAEFAKQIDSTQIIDVSVYGDCSKNGYNKDFTHFAAVNSSSGRTSCEWVQLWENGPKWATFNVGATITDYAKLMVDNDTTTLETNTNHPPYHYTANVGGLYPWNNPNLNGRKTTWTSSVSTGISDVATTLWGSNWKTPTQAQLDTLQNSSYNKTTWTWCDGSAMQYVAGCTLKGFKVSGKGKYTNSSIFLPGTGYFSHDNEEIRNPSGGGYYWSETENGNGDSYYLYFTQDVCGMSKTRCNGLSVRAILVDTAELKKVSLTIYTNGCSSANVITCIKDQPVRITATAPECSKFVRWSDNDTSNPRNLTITQDSTLTAIFEKIQFNVSINTSDSIKGKVKME